MRAVLPGRDRVLTGGGQCHLTLPKPSDEEEQPPLTSERFVFGRNFNESVQPAADRDTVNPPHIHPAPGVRVRAAQLGLGRYHVPRSPAPAPRRLPAAVRRPWAALRPRVGTFLLPAAVLPGGAGGQAPVPVPPPPPAAARLP